MSTIGVFIALGGTSYAVTQLPKNSVGEKQLRASAVTSDKIKNGTIARDDLSANAALSGPRGPRGDTGPAGPTGPAGASAAPEAWKPLPFPAGWANSSSTYGNALQTVEYRKDQLGTVELRGAATYVTGSIYNAVSFAALPDGYRPQRTRVFVVATQGSTTVRPSQLSINPDGTFHIYGGPEGEPDFVSFDGVRFDVN